LIDVSTEVLPHTIEPHPITGFYNGKFGMWLFLASEVMLFGALFSSYVLLRVGAPHGTWPTHAETHLSVPIGTFNTLVLIVSSVTMVFAWAALKMNDLAKARRFLLATAGLATLFLVIKLTFEYSPKLQHDKIWLAEGHHISGHEGQTLTGHIVEDIPGQDLVIEPDAHGGGHAEKLRIPRQHIARISTFGPEQSNYFGLYWTITGLHGLHVLGGIIVILWLALPGVALWHSRPAQFTNRVECTGLYWHFVDLVWIFVFPILYLL
jgi:cytochrome c oxidase subunit 3